MCSVFLQILAVERFAVAEVNFYEITRRHRRPHGYRGYAISQQSSIITIFYLALFPRYGDLVAKKSLFCL